MSQTNARELEVYLDQVCEELDRRAGALRHFRDRWRLIPLPAAITLSLGLTACNGDDDPPPAQTEICDDAADNDGDQQVDCQDSDCRNFPACLPTPYSAPFEFA